MTLLSRIGAAALALAAFAPPPARAALATDLDGDTLRVTQTANGGPVLITVYTNQTVGVSENMGVPTFLAPVTELELLLLDGSGSALEIEFLAPLEGSLSVWLGSGDRTVMVTGEPEVGGDFSMWGGPGFQTVGVDASAPVTSGGDFSLEGVNQFSSPGVPLVVGGDLRVSMEGETARALFDPFYLDVAGSFTYLGSSEVDQVDIGYGYIDVRGKVAIALGDGITGSADMQFVKLKTSGGNDHRFAGSVSISAGDSTNGDLVEVEENVVLVKGIKLALGDGFNSTILRGGTESKVQYRGGAGVDIVTLGIAAPSAKLSLGADSDTVLLVPTLDLTKLAIDFGEGNDEYLVEVGTQLPAAEKIKNLP
jgi:hypothetical protein